MVFFKTLEIKFAIDNDLYTTKWKFINIFSSKSFYTYTILSISSKFDKIKEHSKRRITSN